MATVIVRPGGSVANIGVHGKPVELALNELWIKNIDISMGLVNTNTLAMLLKLVTEKKLPSRVSSRTNSPSIRFSRRTTSLETLLNTTR